jgi:hypothetical protein
MLHKISFLDRGRKIGSPTINVYSNIRGGVNLNSSHLVLFLPVIPVSPLLPSPCRRVLFSWVLGAQFLPSLNKNLCQVHVCLLFLVRYVHLHAQWATFQGHCSLLGGLVWFSPLARILTHSGLTGGVSRYFVLLPLFTHFGPILVNTDSS